MPHEIDVTVDAPLARPLVLNVTVICSSADLSAWEAKLIRSIAGLASVHLDLVRVAESRAVEPSWRRIGLDGLNSLCQRRLGVQTSEPFPRELRKALVAEEQIADTLAQLSPDVVLDLTCTAATTALRSPPPYGIWSLTLTDCAKDENGYRHIVPNGDVAAVSLVARLPVTGTVILREAAL